MKPLRDGSIERLLDRQARLWASQPAVESREADAPRANLVISQHPFSGARELAQRVATMSGWEVFDRQILDALHSHDKLGKSVLDSLDERLLSYREDWLYHIFVPGHTSSTGYVRRLSELVFAIGMRGHNVFVGRGASFILPREHRLAVLGVRSFDSRVEHWLQANSSTNRNAAKRALTRMDRERAEFIWRSFHREVDDPLAYDLCINLDAMETEQAARIVLEALRARFRDEVPTASRAHPAT
jgi:hypothetical protein